MRRCCWLALITAGSALFVLSGLAPVRSLGEKLVLGLVAPAGTDVNLITSSETHPKVTQNEGRVWSHGNTIVVIYNDSSGSALTPPSNCGFSVSTDGGTSFSRLAEKFNVNEACNAPGAVFYSLHSGKWHAFFVVPSNVGVSEIAHWSSPDALSWTFVNYVLTNNVASSPAAWVDNNAASQYFGRQYVGFVDAAGGSAAPFVTYSGNDGSSWSAASELYFDDRAVVQVTGSPGGDGAVFVQTLDGLGKLDSPRQNYIYRSTDGGDNWTQIQQNAATFLPPGRANSMFYSGMYTTPVSGYWRTPGHGQAGVGPGGVVHYTYAARINGSSDPGDIFYIRSLDNGATWSAPLRLNTDMTTRGQWTPSLAVNVHGNLFVSWYDERNTTDDSLQRYGRTSSDNGSTWGAEVPLSDVIFPKPLQPDTSVAADLVSRTEHAAFNDDGTGRIACHTWTDGRVSLNGAPQQDVFFDTLAFAVSTHIVTSFNDANDGVCDTAHCSLREALNAANADPTDARITFANALSGTIELGSALPNISSNVIIDGPGAARITVRRNTGGDYRIFTISNGNNPGPVVQINGLTMANGRVANGNYPEQSGGGIFNDRGAVTLTNCVISGNGAAGGISFGGGVLSRGGSVTLNRCTLAGNTAGLFGGGIYNDGGILVVASSTIENNTTTNSGGGLRNNATTGHARAILINSTFSGNEGGGFGGAITNYADFGFSARAELISCTIAANAANTGGGVYNSAGNASSGVTTLIGTLLKTGARGANLANSGGSITSRSHNLSDDSAGGFLIISTDKPNTNPQLDPAGLKENGGLTRTIALQPGSPAINMGTGFQPRIDQRGFVRAGGPDIGAFEFGGAPIRLTAIRRLPNGRIAMEGIGVPNAPHSVQASPDLDPHHFAGARQTHANASGVFQHEDAGTTGLAKRFFRAIYP